MEHPSLSRRRAKFWSCALLAGSLCLACGKATQTPPEPATSATPPRSPKKKPDSAALEGGTAHKNAPAEVSLAAAAPAKAIAKHVVVVSVDGLAPRFLEQLVSEGQAPHFAALQKQAAWTHQARTDKTHTITLPNHTSMLTGLPVLPTKKYPSHFAHNYVHNRDPSPGDTLHRYRMPNGSYTSSMFDVAHDNGLATAMYASKSKFVLYENTYNAAGAADTVGPDNGTRKIDTVVINGDAAALVAAFVEQLQTKPPALSFVHLNQPDGAGHSIGWGTPAYLAAVQRMDALVGEIVGALQSPSLAGRSALILTADHGGVNNHHADKKDRRNFEIPFYVFGPGVAPGDAYAVFDNRFAPGETNPGYEASKQPLRNGDAGNLALFLLGLEPIPESLIHSAGLRSP